MTNARESEATLDAQALLGVERVDGEFLGKHKSEVLKNSPGGEHYRKMAIEPIEYIEKNQLTFHEGNVVKYVTRWRNKNGIEDLRKARFYLDRLIELVEAGAIT